MQYTRVDIASQTVESSAVLQQTWILARTLHGQNFSLQMLPKNLAKNTSNFVNITVCLKKDYFVLPLNYPYFFLYISYTSAFQNLTQFDQQTYLKKENIAMPREFRTNIVSSREVRIYTDNVRASVTNCMSDRRVQCCTCGRMMVA